ncbi:hypothetical protein ANRL4_05570 [Anaerolineae bacterium]|nr:hypothetical protein ANRL4_05570 [Anaerolineae bacterium]
MEVEFLGLGQVVRHNPVVILLLGKSRSLKHNSQVFVAEYLAVKEPIYLGQLQQFEFSGTLDGLRPIVHFQLGKEPMGVALDSGPT